MTEYPIVRFWEAKDEAESMGRKAFEGLETDRYDHVSPTQHGRWDTHHLPKIRQLAGHNDRFDKGTYAEPQDVIFIEHENDQTGKVINSAFIHDDLVEAFCKGAYEEI